MSQSIAEPTSNPSAHASEASDDWKFATPAVSSLSRILRQMIETIPHTGSGEVVEGPISRGAEGSSLVRSSRSRQDPLRGADVAMEGRIGHSARICECLLRIVVLLGESDLGGHIGRFVLGHSHRFHRAIVSAPDSAGPRSCCHCPATNLRDTE